MSGNEQAKQARAALLESDPGFVEAIDALKGTFGAKLTALQVGDITIGPIDRATADWESAIPYTRYQRPGEANEEWKEIKGAIDARITAGKRSTGRGNRASRR